MRELAPGFIRAVREGLSGVPGIPRALRARRLRRLKAVASRLLVLGVGGTLVFAAAQFSGPDPLLHLGLCWLLHGAVFLVAAGLRQRLVADRDLLPLALMPVSEADILRRQTRRALRQAAWVAAAVPLAFGVAGWAATGDVVRAAACGIGIGVLFPVVASALALASWRSRWVALLVYAGLMLPVPFAALAIVSRSAREVAAEWLASHGDVLAAMWPTGWLVLPWHGALAGGNRLLLAALAPVPVLAATLPGSWAWLKEHYRSRDSVLAQAYAEVPEDADEGLREAMAEATARPRTRGETAIVDDLLAGRFLQPRLSAPTGWIECRVWAWWTPRQRVVAEFLMLAWPRWTRNLGLAVGAAAFGLVLGIVLWQLGVQSWGMAWLFGGALSGVLGLGAFGAFQPGLQAIADGRLLLSPFLLTPVRPGEIIMTIWKAVTVRTLAMLPVAALAGALAGVLGGDAIASTDFMSGPGGLALVAVQATLIPWVAFPLVVVAALRRSLSSYRRSFAGWGAGLFLAGAVTVNLFGALACLFPLFGLAVAALLTALNWTQFVVLAWLVNSGRVEGLRTPPSQRAVTTA